MEECSCEQSTSYCRERKQILSDRYMFTIASLRMNESFLFREVIDPASPLMVSASRDFSTEKIEILCVCIDRWSLPRNFCAASYFL